MDATPRKPAGGLRSVTLYPAGAVAEVELEGPVCRGIRVRSGTAPLEVPLVEQRSECTDEATAAQGPFAIRRTLRIETSRWQGRALFDGDFLHRAATEGFVALVEAVDGERFVAGWSARLGGGQPLRLERLTLSTGRRLAEAPSAELVLVCADAAPALLYNPENENTP